MSYVFNDKDIKKGIRSEISKRSVIDMLSQSQTANRYLYSRAVHSFHQSPNVKR